MGSITAFHVDGFDTSQLDLVVDNNLSGWRDAVDLRPRRRRVPNAYSHALISTKLQTRPRQLRITGNMVSVDVPTLLSNLDELKYRLNQGELQCKFEDSSTRFFKCYLDGSISIQGIPPAMIQIAHTIAIPLICLDPRHYDDTPQAVGFSAATAMPMGTAKVEPSIDMTVGTFTLTYSGGATLAVVGATAPPITVDMANKTIMNSSSASMISKLISGNFFSLDPNDGDFVASTWPTLATSAGSGTANYNKAYL